MNRAKKTRLSATTTHVPGTAASTRPIQTKRTHKTWESRTEQCRAEQRRAEQSRAELAKASKKQPKAAEPGRASESKPDVARAS